MEKQYTKREGLCDYCRQQKPLRFISYKKTLFDKIYVGKWLCIKCAVKENMD